MDQRCYEFEAVIESTPDGKGAFVRFPLNLRKEFGVGRLKVDAAFDGVPYAGSLVNMGVKNPDGSICYILGVRKDIRAALHKQAGDRVRVTVRPRGEPAAQNAGNSRRQGRHPAGTLCSHGLFPALDGSGAACYNTVK